MYQTFHRQLTTTLKLCGKFNQTGSVHDIQQMSWVETRGLDRYIVLNNLRIRLKSVIQKPRQTIVFISYDKYIVLGEHLEPMVQCTFTFDSCYSEIAYCVLHTYVGWTLPFFNKWCHISFYVIYFSAAWKSFCYTMKKKC